MSPIRCRLVAVASITLFLIGIPAQAASKSKSTPKPPPDTSSAIQQVEAKDQSVQIVNHADHNSVHIYKIDDFTKITLNGNPAKFAAITKGMVVTDLTERDAHTLDNITLSGAPPAKPKSKSKHK